MPHDQLVNLPRLQEEKECYGRLSGWTACDWPDLTLSWEITECWGWWVRSVCPQETGTSAWSLLLVSRQSRHLSHRHWPPSAAHKGLWWCVQWQCAGLRWLLLRYCTQICGHKGVTWWVVESVGVNEVVINKYSYTFSLNRSKCETRCNYSSGPAWTITFPQRPDANSYPPCQFILHSRPQCRR